MNGRVPTAVVVMLFFAIRHRWPWDDKAPIGDDDPVYPVVYQVLEKLGTRNNVTAFLSHGSVLGALRHNGVIPFFERDVDITVLVEGTAPLVPEPDWIAVSFGYTVPIKGSRLYLDVWVHSRDPGTGLWKCIGSSDRCWEWEEQNNKKVFLFNGPRAKLLFPLRQHKFGPRTAAIPQRSEDYMDEVFWSWRHHCTRLRPCLALRPWYTFA